MDKLRFEALKFRVETSFWELVEVRKLRKWRLDESEREIRAVLRFSGESDSPAEILINARSLVEEGEVIEEGEGGFSLDVSVPGLFLHTNKKSTFQDAERGHGAAMSRGLKDVCEALRSGENMFGLWTCFLFGYLDLKHHKYPHACACPSLSWEGSVPLVLEVGDVVPSGLKAAVEETAVRSGGVWVVRGFLEGVDGVWSEVGVEEEKEGDRVVWVVGDSGAREDSVGWTVRNVLHWLGARRQGREVEVLSWRVGRGGEVLEGSRMLRVRFGEEREDMDRKLRWPLVQGVRGVGWEPRPDGRPRIRIGATPQSESASSSDFASNLNLELMHWRHAPELDLDRVTSLRALVLGVGTLGSYVTRSLLGWGVRKFDLVDSGRVSMSNPTRQPLFEAEDAIKNEFKATAAANALQRIVPGCDVTPHVVQIPCPDHPSSDSSAVETTALLDELVRRADVVFLLTDSRESRWLPSLLCRVHDTPAISVALGFDSWLVVRHGRAAPPPHNRLGCYFCSDVVSPTNSEHDRTFDQMCTVTRPGLAPMASGAAVELLIATLHHPLGFAAPHPQTSTFPHPHTAAPSAFGHPPHQIRYFLPSFQSLPVTNDAFEHCTACSDLMVKAYREHGPPLVESITRDGSLLPKLSGLDRFTESIATPAQTTEDIPDGWEEF